MGIAKKLLELPFIEKDDRLTVKCPMLCTLSAKLRYPVNVEFVTVAPPLKMCTPIPEGPPTKRRFSIVKLPLLVTENSVGPPVSVTEPRTAVRRRVTVVTEVVVGIVTVTGVDVTRVLRHAKVDVSILGSESDRAATLDGLGSVASHLRSRIGRALRLRLAPEIAFKLDQSVAHAARIESLLAQLHDDRTPDGDRPIDTSPPSGGGPSD